jgi:tRNA pseudouridine38-40 synthase
LRLALGLEYDGAAFSGWQTQPGGNTVQDTLERALRDFAGPELPKICAGRTDAGVHATCQVVHVDTEVDRPTHNWVRGVNSFLPRTVALRWCVAVPDTFHARFGALSRRYDYWLLNDPVRRPLAEQRVGWVFRPLDEARMRAAASHLLGTHDFSAFRAAECQAASPVRTVHELAIERRGSLLRLRIAANAFLHHMVRNIVGALVEVGVSRQVPAWVADVLATRDRTRAAPTFSASGLYLTGVQYDASFGLPEPLDAAPLVE